MSDNRQTTGNSGMRLILPLPGNEIFARQLAEAGGWELGAIETRRFPDGETYVRILSDVADKTIDLVCTLAAPAEVAVSMEVVAAAVTETRVQSLAIISPPLEPQARMEVVEIMANVFELKLRHANTNNTNTTTVLADVKPEIPVPASPVAAVLANVMTTVPTSVSPAKASRIEVANGNGVTGMAKRISDVLGRQGISVSRLSNELPYKQQETKIQYRAGFEKTAASLKTALKGHAVVVVTPSLSPNSDVRLVLGKDAIAHMALIEGLSSDTLLALNALTE